MISVPALASRLDHIIRNRRVPLPYRASGKLEYASIFALLISVVVPFLDVYYQDTPDGEQLGRPVVIFFGVTFVPMCLIEIALATLHAIVAWRRCKDARYLFEATERRAEGRRRLL